MPGKSTTTPRKTPHEHVTEQIVALLDQGTVAWHRAWHAACGPPRNGVSLKRYRGFNVFVLSLLGYAYPWWFTPRQAESLEMTIRQGETVSWITFWKNYVPKTARPAPLADPPDDDPLEDEDAPRRRTRLVVRAYKVLNLAQLEGPGVAAYLDKHQGELPKTYDHDPIADCEAFLAAVHDPPRIVFEGSQPRYNKLTDTVTVPPLRYYDSAPEYYTSIYHELIHATGAEKRLRRPSLVAPSVYGSPIYSQEELVAEMGAAFLAAETGIGDRTIENSAAYLQGWKTFLMDNPRALLIAGAQAQKAAAYLHGDHRLEQNPKAA